MLMPYQLPELVVPPPSPLNTQAPDEEEGSTPSMVRDDVDGVSASLDSGSQAMEFNGVNFDDRVEEWMFDSNSTGTEGESLSQDTLPL